MNDQERQEYINYRLEKASETLEVVELLIENKKWNSSVNRLYYATYYAISALLFQAKISAKTHAGVKRQFYLNYINTGKIASEYGKVYSDLSDWRQKGDYGDFFDFKEEDIMLIFEPAKELINRVNKEIEKYSSSG